MLEEPRKQVIESAPSFKTLGHTWLAHDGSMDGSNSPTGNGSVTGTLTSAWKMAAS